MSGFLSPDERIDAYNSCSDKKLMLHAFAADEIIAELKKVLAHTCEHVDSLRIRENALWEELFRQWRKAHELMCDCNSIAWHKCEWPKPEILTETSE